jgi:hypothetical protein
MDRQRVDLKVELVDPQAAGGQGDRQVLGADLTNLRFGRKTFFVKI